MNTVRKERHAWRSAWRYGRFMVQNYPLFAWMRFIQRKHYEPGRVSIITATHNRPEQLEEAIESVRQQTYRNWEQIIVSDGKDERLPRLVNRIGDPRLQVHHTSRLAVMGNYQRNVALRYATGEYVLFLDDDNIIYPKCLEIMVQGFSRADIGYVICPIHYGSTIKDPKLGFQYREIDLLNYMVRRKLIEKTWGQPVHGIADYLLIKKISEISSGNYLNEIIGHHR